MTDTLRVPSEATTGTSPAPEAQPLPAAGAAAATAAAAEPEALPDAQAQHGAGAGLTPGAPAEERPAPSTATAPRPAGAEEAAPAAEPAETTGAAATPPAKPELSPAACAALLAEHFPALFGGPPRPLKLRIQADIQARAPGLFTRKALSVFLHRHTTSNAYLNALVKAPQRVDLDGADAGEIAAEHRSAASEELARRRAVHETRRREARLAGQAAARSGAGTGADAGAGPVPREARGDRPPGRQENRAPKGRPNAGGPSLPGPNAAPLARSGAERGEARRPAPAAAHLPRTDTAPAATAVAAPVPPAVGAPPAPPPPPPMSEAERERAALLRAYEGSTLTRANFCVLKRIDEASLEAQLALARQERAQRPVPARPEAQRNDRAGGRHDEPRGPRRPRPSAPGR